MKFSDPFSASLRRAAELQQNLAAYYKQLPLTQRLLKGAIQALLALLASSAAYGLGLLLHTDNAFWAALTALSVTQQSYADTRSSSHDQWLGALIGGSTSFFGAWIGGENYGVYAVSLCIGIIASWLFNIGRAGKITGTTVATVMLVPHTAPFWDTAPLRLLQVAIGLVCALLAVRGLDWLQSRLLNPIPSTDHA